MKGVANGRNVIVTGIEYFVERNLRLGGSKGIGKGIAMSFALAGANSVTISARSKSQLEETKKEIKKAAPKTSVFAIPADLTSSQAVDELYSILKKNGITADILVNNAGMMSPFTNITDSDPLSWWGEMSVHLNSTYLMTRGFLKQLPSKGPRPTIVNTSSVGGVEPVLVKPGSSAYCVAKMAIVKFTEFIAAEHPEVRAFVYHPGGVATDLVTGAFPKEALSSGFWSDTPELAGGYCLWMSTDKADFMIGRWGSYDSVYDLANVSVNWDVEELEAKKNEIESKDLLKVLPITH
jgi:NAD(P)-dependent dehydrogenase (short-subunit alcohol dehydrogenase family)